MMRFIIYVIRVNPGFLVPLVESVTDRILCQGPKYRTHEKAIADLGIVPHGNNRLYAN